MSTEFHDLLTSYPAPVLKDWEKAFVANGYEKTPSIQSIKMGLTRWQNSRAAQGLSVFSTGHCSSSMDLAANMVKHGLLATWDSVIASSQESGRGQLGRSWHSPPGNLYVSLGLPLLRDGWQDLLSILVATGVLKILLDMDLPARIKWPNDILVGSKKVGGILIEEKQGVILAGIGINLVSSPPFNTMRDRSPIEAASLADFGVNFTPPGIWIELLGSLKARIEKITSTLGKDEFIDAVVPYLAYLGETVVINSENIRGLKATFLGLDPCGGLIIGEKNSERVVRSGSIIPAS